MMEMGNAISSVSCVKNSKNEGSSHRRCHAVLDLVDSDNGDREQELATSHTNTELKDDSMSRKLTESFHRFFRRLEELIFPKSLLLNSIIINNTQHHRQHQISSGNIGTRNSATSRTMNSTALLRRCETIHEQHAYIQTILKTCQHLHGMDGLQALGLEYRLIPCDEHKSNQCDSDLSIAAVDTVLSNEDACNGEHVGDRVYLSESALHRIDTFDIDDDDENDNMPLEQEGHVTLVELSKVKSEKYLSLSNRSDSILSDDGGGSSTNIIASHNADVCTTPSLATTFTAAIHPYEDSMDYHHEKDNDGMASDLINAKSSTIPNGDVHTSTTPSVVVYKNPSKKIVHQFCHLCERQLYDIESNTCITDQNRNEYIANGDMYELVSRFVQEYAHDVMIQEGNLIWSNIDDDTMVGGNSSTNIDHVVTKDATTASARPSAIKGTGPIRCLISKDHPCLLKDKAINGSNMDHRPTLLICTGRGKVRAGIFSRHHLICTGLERSTAIPYIHEAIHRNIHVIIVDPNVHGETHGYKTFTKSMNFFQSYYNCGLDSENEAMSQTSNHVASHEESIPNNPFCRDMYILSHSASGGHLVRYFLDKCQTQYIRSIRAIAFTDSTHSIQWAKGAHQTYLCDLLQSWCCVYFRCSSSTRDTIAGDGDSKWYLHPAGAVVQTDSFWRHRFGSIRTVWAGTNEHSQTNWFAHAKIWEHFDQFLFP